jgi:hypothetical protein
MHAHAPDAPPSARAQWALPAALGAAAAGGVVAIAALAPSDGGRPICLSQAAFGFDCPFCGGLRCVSALARLDPWTAADHNVVLAVALPLVAVAWLVWMVATLRGRALRVPRVPVATWVALGVWLVVFTVVRNLGADGWTGWLAATASG